MWIQYLVNLKEFVKKQDNNGGNEMCMVMENYQIQIVVGEVVVVKIFLESVELVLFLYVNYYQIVFGG